MAEAFAYGATDYILKPLKHTEIACRLSSALRTKHELEFLKIRQAELEQMASHDGLTGLANRRHFDRFLLEEEKKSRRQMTALALFLADVDCFKNYNDFYGHLQGDQCLRQVALALKKSLQRPGDLSARYGGEEFAGVLPSTDLNGALKLAEAFRAAVENLCIPNEKSTAGPLVTISVGVAVFDPRSIETGTGLLHRADKALYQAKHQGRNRVFSFQ